MVMACNPSPMQFHNKSFILFTGGIFQEKKNGICTKYRLRSVGADQSYCSALMLESLGQIFLHEGLRLY